MERNEENRFRTDDLDDVVPDGCVVRGVGLHELVERRVGQVVRAQTWCAAEAQRAKNAVQ